MSAICLLRLIPIFKPRFSFHHLCLADRPGQTASEDDAHDLDQGDQSGAERQQLAVIDQKVLHQAVAALKMYNSYFLTFTSTETVSSTYEG